MAGKLTEEAIKNAYLQLLEEKPMDKITISEISLTLQSRIKTATGTACLYRFSMI